MNDRVCVQRCNPPGARSRSLLSRSARRSAIDGQPVGNAPTSAEADSGVRRVTISAPNLKTWESSVVVKAGETLPIGPITLGQPDMSLTLHSKPTGAEITIAGTYRGRTPLTVDLAASINYDIVATLPGYANFTKTLFADPGKKVTLDANLQPVVAAVTVKGVPQEAELFIDGKSQGKTPQTLQLSAVEHLIEVRKDGFVTFSGTVTPALGLERLVEYKLISSDRGRALQESAPTVTSKVGYTLRLVPGGTFMMGSERREQGRRPNEGLRPVTLQRPYYIGVTEVTNLQYREFKSDHVSGHVENRSFDLDAQPVVQVSWNEAVAFCNWLSERDGLPPAYEQGGGNKYVLKKPITTGYRLPTEAEWEYAARYVSTGKIQRYPWGDSLPMTGKFGNIAGVETGGALEAQLDGYRDEYPVVAPVGKFQPSVLGLHDLAGNVSEWVERFLSVVRRSLAHHRPARAGSGGLPRDSRCELEDGVGGRAAVRMARGRAGAESDDRLPRGALRRVRRRFIPMRNLDLPRVAHFPHAGPCWCCSPASSHRSSSRSAPALRTRRRRPNRPPRSKTTETLVPDPKESADNNLTFPVDIWAVA